jgi:hypothetical protein
MVIDKISIVCVTRNDNYGINQKERLLHFLKSIPKHRCIEELIIVEWNPLPNCENMYELISGMLLDLPYRVRIITVPTSIHRRFGSAAPVVEFCGKNVGILRATGSYVLCTNPDVIFPTEMFDYIAKNGLRKDCFYRAMRVDVARELAFERCDNIIELARSNILKEHSDWCGRLFFNACGDFTLVNKEVWIKAGGYIQSNDFFVHLDSEMLFHLNRNFRLKQVVLPFSVYHIDHGRRQGRFLYRGQPIPSDTAGILGFCSGLRKRYKAARMGFPLLKLSEVHLFFSL